MELRIIHCIFIIISAAAALYVLLHSDRSVSSEIPPIPPPRCLSSPRMPEIHVPRPEGDQYESQWLPIYETRTPYNEDEIVSLLREFEHLYMKLSSLFPTNTVDWPPEGGGHAINETLCRELGMDPTVISLLPRLTYPNSDGDGIHLDTWMSYVDYRKDHNIRDGRYASYIQPFEMPDDEVKMLPYELILAWGDREVDVIILDTKENTIRVVNQQVSYEEMNPPWYTSLEYPGEYHYRNYWPRHAPTYLRMLIQKLRCLDIIPSGGDLGSDMILSNYDTPWLRRKMRHILIGTYGWPNSFQEERYHQEKEDVWNRALAEYEQLGSPDIL